MNNETQDPLLLDHEADGIRELDNMLPRWWVWLFYSRIVFAVVYMVYYHVLEAGELQAAEYREREQSRRRRSRPRPWRVLKRRIGHAGTLQRPARSSRRASKPFPHCARHAIAPTAAVWSARTCAMIIGSTASNYVGQRQRSLQRRAGKRHGDLERIFKPDEIHAVASYIYTLRGTHPAESKPPENQTPAKNRSERI